MTRNTKFEVDHPSDSTCESCDQPDEFLQRAFDISQHNCKFFEFDKTVISVKQTIRRLHPSEVPDCDPLSKVRQSLIGRFYVRYLKKNRMIRLATFWLWYNGYPVYVRYKTRNNKVNRSLPLVKLSEYSKRSPESVYILAQAETVVTPPPTVFPDSNRNYLVSPHEKFTFPEIFVASVKNALLMGGSNLVMLNDQVLCHDLYDFLRDYTSEELHGRTVVNPKTKRLRWLMNDPLPAVIPVAASFIDACAYNYAHWMTEVLPRICLFCQDKRFLDIPIVINDNLHPNLIESLLMVTGGERDIFALPLGRNVRINRLLCTSPTGYVPFERRSRKLKEHSHGLFSPHALKMLRERLKSAVSQESGNHLPKKIYLERNSSGRKVLNSSEIKLMLVENGFVIIEPEKLTLEQQISLFSNADVVVGSSGAALANMLFCKPNTRIIILISKLKDTSYWYWQNMACATGHHVNYVMGEICRSNTSGIHSDFNIDTQDLLNVIGDN